MVRPEGSNLEEGGVVVVVGVVCVCGGEGGPPHHSSSPPHVVMPNRMELFFLGCMSFLQHAVHSISTDHRCGQTKTCLYPEADLLIVYPEADLVIRARNQGRWKNVLCPHKPTPPQDATASPPIRFCLQPLSNPPVHNWPHRQEKPWVERILLHQHFCVLGPLLLGRRVVSPVIR